MKSSQISYRDTIFIDTIPVAHSTYIMCIRLTSPGYACELCHRAISLHCNYRVLLEVVSPPTVKLIFSAARIKNDRRGVHVGGEYEPHFPEPLFPFKAGVRRKFRNSQSAIRSKQW